MQIVGDRRDCIVNHVHVFRKLENLVVVVVSSGCDALKHIDPSLASTLGSASTGTGSDACLAATYHAHKNIKALDMEQTFPSFSPIHLSHEFQLQTFNLQLLTLSASSSIHEPTQHSPKMSRRFSREELSFNEGCKACGTSLSSPQKPTAEQPAHTKKQPKGLKKLIKRLNEYKTCVLEKRRRKKTLAALNRILDYAVDPSACSDPDLDAVLANIHRLPSRSGHADAQSDGSSSSSLERILTAGKDCTGVCHCRRKRVNMITLDSESESEREDGGDYDADDEDDVEDGDEIARERDGDQQSGDVFGCGSKEQEISSPTLYNAKGKRRRHPSHHSPKAAAEQQPAGLGADLPDFGEREELLLKDLQEAVESTASTCVPGGGSVGLTEEMSGMEAMERWLRGGAGEGDG